MSGRLGQETEGVVTIMGPCVACNQIVMGNPKYVPSFNNEMVCERCMKFVNKARVDAGMEPIEIHPEAYEPLDESEL